MFSQVLDAQSPRHLLNPRHWRRPAVRLRRTPAPALRERAGVGGGPLRRRRARVGPAPRAAGNLLFPEARRQRAATDLRRPLGEEEPPQAGLCRSRRAGSRALNAKTH